MPESAAQSARREALARLAARRRAAVTMLEISAATCKYGAAQLRNGIGPAEAAETARFVAQELELMAATLRRAIAGRLGVSPRTVRLYLSPGAEQSTPV